MELGLIFATCLGVHDLHGFSWFSSETLLESQAPKAPEVSTDGAETARVVAREETLLEWWDQAASRPSSWKCNLKSFGWNAPVRKCFHHQPGQSRQQLGITIIREKMETVDV